MKARTDAIGGTTTLAERKRRAGQRLAVGFLGHDLGPELTRHLREMGPSHAILFARNVVEPGQVRTFNDALHGIAPSDAPLLVAVDQEGGRVARIREPFCAPWPSARCVGRAERYTEAVATGLARELLAMGFDVDFAPVADVDSNPKNPIIGDRSFDSDAARVAAHVGRYVRAMQAAGLAATAKHFPGHGDTSVDSHLDLPCVERELGDLRAVELVPFREAVASGVAAVMTAHVLFPALDEDLPATLSPRILPTLLRGELGYDGLVYSDDLEMGAVAGRWSPGGIVRLATAASVDVLLACKEAALQVALFEAMVRDQEDDPGADDRYAASVCRIDDVRRRFQGRVRPALTEVGAANHRSLALMVADEGAP